MIINRGFQYLIPIRFQLVNRMQSLDIVICQVLVCTIQQNLIFDSTETGHVLNYNRSIRILFAPEIIAAAIEFG